MRNTRSHSIHTQWMGGMQFNAAIGKHTISMDAPVIYGGEEAGPSPKAVLLSSLAACTGMDVVAILKENNITLQDFSLKVDGSLSTSKPKYYTEIHLFYKMIGNPEHKKIALNAIRQSQEYMCGIGFMLRKRSEVSWSIIYNDQEVFNNKVSERRDS